ncbi:MAG: pyruvate formate-lyase-activating protein [Candidatus Moranbacteria bacterium]|nr:pyruvate formate-lyase-activating protein [Candidatus Moranbacteria bacterium]
MLQVHSVETFGTHEGPGIRLVIFTQGCYFRCLYCHNPDTQALSGGTDMSVSEIVTLAEKQKAYFGKDGGVTVSGGEPTIHAKELIELFRALHEKDIHTALDTNGALLNDDTKALYEETDLVLLDTKQINEAKHQTLTGMSNENTLALAAYRESTGKAMWLRYVLVPGYSDDEADLIALGEYFKDYRHIERIEILPYHTLGAYKYEKLGRKNPLEGVAMPSKETIAKAVSIFERYFKKVAVR